MKYFGHKKEWSVSQEIIQNKLTHWRIDFLVLFIITVSLVLVIRLYNLQVLAFDEYKASADRQHKVFLELYPKRGEIFLKDEAGNYPLAVNREMHLIYAVPKEVKEKEKTAEALSLVLSMDKGEILRKVSNDIDPFEIIKHLATEEEFLKIKEAKIVGIKEMPEYTRYYPGGEISAHVTGFVGSNGNEYSGKYGIEGFWEDNLKGSKGKLIQERDAAGRWISISDRDIKPAQDGSNLILTISYPVQYEVEKILKNAVEKFQAESGLIIVMEPKTGKILALANLPNFNPNEYFRVEDMARFTNSAISISYESGSVFKPVTMAIGIDDGKINPDTEYIDTGNIQSGGFTIKNSEEKVYGKINMTQVLEDSVNTGVIFVEKEVGNKNFYEYVKRFGFGTKTGVALAGESDGQIKNLEELKTDVNFFTASFGQGIMVTPIQLLSAYSVIANGGKLMKPQIIDRIEYSNGKTEDIQAEEVRRVISEEAAQMVRKMLLSVVVNGHGKRAAVPGYLVGGKTGTAQVSKIGEKGYEEDLTIGSFAGFAPIEDPQFAVLVKIVNPKGVQWAESTAAPAFGEVMKFLLSYYKVRPTEEYELK